MSEPILSDSLRKRLGPEAGEHDPSSLEARVAARWWGDRLRSPAKLDHLGAQGDTSDSGSGLMAILLGMSLQGKEREAADLNEGRIRDFERHLSQAIDQGRVGRGFAFSLGVDYGPDGILADAADAAGFKAGSAIFPWKTMMWVEEGSVKVREGYGAEVVELALEEPYTPGRIRLPGE